MVIQEVVSRLKVEGVIKREVIKIDELKGGTVSKLFLLHFSDQSKVVVKFNAPVIVQSEAEFLITYEQIDFLPKVIYVGESFEYLVYSFVEGSTSYPKLNKVETLKAIVKLLINEYKPVHHASGWGWADEPSKSWQEFLLKRVEEASELNNLVLGKEDYDLVYKLIGTVILETEKPFLLHGDCGVHNFIFRDEKISAVIDPLPVWGPPIYDLIYAFCSSPDDLTLEAISEAAKAVTVENIIRLKEQVLIGLYLRIASCVKHHPSDLPDYLKAWTYWKEIVNLK